MGNDDIFFTYTRINACLQKIHKDKSIYTAFGCFGNRYGADLDNIRSEARTQYICGVIDEQGLQDAWDDWANKGGNDLIAEVNEAYAADQETAEADENTEAATEEAATEEAATEEASSQAE